MSFYSNHSIKINQQLKFSFITNSLSSQEDTTFIYILQRTKIQINWEFFPQRKFQAQMDLLLNSSNNQEKGILLLTQTFTENRKKKLPQLVLFWY